MKKENETKETQTPQEQSENTQPVETTPAVDTNPEAGADVDRPEDTPADGPGLEAVTVVIVADNELHGALAAASVKQNLKGVDGEIQVVTGENLRGTLGETLLEHLTYVKTERIILMTDGMMILNPVTIYDIGCLKLKMIPNGTDVPDCTRNTGMPVLMHKSLLVKILEDLASTNDLDTDIINYYFHRLYRKKFDPIEIGNWRKDPWLLPIISVDPPISIVKMYATLRKFLHVSPQSWSDELVKFLEERFAE